MNANDSRTSGGSQPLTLRRDNQPRKPPWFWMASLISVVVLTASGQNPAYVMTLPANGISATSATLNGAVQTLMDGTSSWFEWGTEHGLR